MYLSKLHIILNKLVLNLGHTTTGALEFISVLFSLHRAGGKTLLIIGHINLLLIGFYYLTLIFKELFTANEHILSLESDRYVIKIYLYCRVYNFLENNFQINVKCSWSYRKDSKSSYKYP